MISEEKPESFELKKTEVKTEDVIKNSAENGKIYPNKDNESLEAVDKRSDYTSGGTENLPPNLEENKRQDTEVAHEE